MTRSEPLRKATLAAVAALLLTGTAALALSPSIQLEGNAFKVRDWDPPRREPANGWASIFAVYAGTGEVPPLSGAYTIEHGSLVFRPRFPFSPGVQYRAVFSPPAGAAITRVFDGPAQETKPAARVEQVYPSANILPSNQLRLYIYFSAPMSRGEAGAHVRLLDDKGKILPGIFLPGEELWDRSFRRLTLTFDPGRIKRGLTSNEAMGPPIVEGKQYTLMIDRDWPDARGVRMVEGFRKLFRGGPSLRHAPDPAQWKLMAPKAGTSEAVSLIFHAPMNYPLLQRMILVSGPSGQITGTVRIENQETEWSLTPRQPWKTGEYKLVVDTGLEDLAGNHIGQLFDIDVFNHVTQHITTSTASLPFTVK